MIVDSRLAGVAPDGLSPVEAAALPLVGVTAYIAVHDRAEVRPGQNVLVHGGTGGVGHVVVQLVKALGARVTATVSTEAKREAAASLGADEVLLREDTPENQFETVIDTIGGANLSHSFRQVVTNGRVVTIAARTTADLTPLHGKNATFHAVFMGLPLITGEGRERHGAIILKR